MSPALRMGVAALLLAFSCVVPLVDSHAVMIEPKSRQWNDYLLNYNYNPHAVNAGGKLMVSRDYKLIWPARNINGICGDEAGKSKWMKDGPVQGTYKAGSTINVDVLFAQNHLGRMNVRVCPLNAKDSKECTELTRADGKGRNFDLPWTPGWAGVTDGYVKPLNTDGFTAYKLKPIGKAEGCRAWACDQFKGMYVYRTQWQLPKGFTCQKCILQMYYLTGSSCWPPCAGGNCRKPVDYAYCDAPKASYPEEFWGCSDITIQSAHRRQLMRGTITKA